MEQHALTPAAPRFPEELRDAAAQAAGGWVYAIDPAYDPRGRTPPEGIVGAWKIADDGQPTGEFVANPDYKPSTADLAEGSDGPGGGD